MKSPSRLRVGGVFALATFVAGCAGEPSEQLFVKPGRFDYLDCPELVRDSQTTAKREQELRTLIERAEREPAGKIIAIPSYHGDLLKAQGEQKMLAEFKARKQCPPDTPAAPPSQGSGRAKR
jgi:hypothetical protein